MRRICGFERQFLTSFVVIDLTGPDRDDGNYPPICTTLITDLLPDDKENKGKQPLDTYIRFKGRGRYKLAKCVSYRCYRLPPR